MMGVCEHNMMYHTKIIFVFLKGHSLNHVLCVGAANSVPLALANSHCRIHCGFTHDTGIFLALATQST